MNNKLKVDDLKKIINKRRIDVNNRKTLERKKFIGKRIVLSVTTSFIAMAAVVGGYNVKMKLVKENINSKNKKINSLIKNINLVGDDEINSIKLGTELENYLDLDLDDEKVEEIDKYGELAILKFKLDEYGTSDGYKDLYKDDLADDLTSIGKCMKNLIYLDNQDIKYGNYNITFETFEDDAYIHADKLYKVSDDLLKQTIKAYCHLDKRETKLQNNIKEYDYLIDGILKLALSDIYLNDNKANVSPDEVRAKIITKKL